MTTDHRAWSALIAAITAAALTSACGSFGAVRSAEVSPGPSVAIQASASTAPGDVPGWFWAYDCPTSCDRRVIGSDLGLTYGWSPSTSGRALALGVGLSGILPYLDGYIQLGAGRTPFGIGARVGPPVTSWREHQLYVRYDIPLGQSARLLLNPALFVHEGRSPNGASPGSFVAFVQGIGVLVEGANVSWTPAIAVVAGRAQRNSYGQQYGPVSTVFGVASLAVTFHRRRDLGRD